MSKKEGKNLTALSQGIMFLSLILIGVVGVMHIIFGGRMDSYIAMIALFVCLFVTGTTIWTLTVINRKYARIILEIRNNDYLADERYDALAKQIHRRPTRNESNIAFGILRDKIVKEIRECRNLEDNTP